MSISPLLSKQKQLQEIDPSLSPFESKRNIEGDRCLFFKKEEVDELLGHYVKFYPNGVLLVLRDEAKDFLKKNNPELKFESKSFIFYNTDSVENINDKKPIFQIHNRNRNRNTRTLEEPIRDLEVVVCEHYLYVKEIGNTTKEYLVDVLTGEKIEYITEDNQLSFDI